MKIDVFTKTLKSIIPILGVTHIPPPGRIGKGTKRCVFKDQKMAKKGSFGNR